ncbi:MAG: hypothetical protein QNJ41_01450 [Xenococcaceae cyanobacterium MO_188.B32]|nr:hypothetical protein [Xenococcaceae cyanobacterium MO_188.B32]
MEIGKIREIREAGYLPHLPHPPYPAQKSLNNPNTLSGEDVLLGFILDLSDIF